MLAPSSGHSNKRQKSANSAAAGGGGSGSGSPPNGIYSFHPEDEYIQKVSTHTQDYTFTRAEPRDTPDAFGLDTGGRVILVKADRLGELVSEFNGAYAAPE